MSETVAAHWSIGEVLSLLQTEFPEITISKIRFLESQGLINPERTPSGYRRFYESDFDRLRWILVQQRDHYLPLKVIRDRLDAGEWEEASSHQATTVGTPNGAVLDLTDDAPVPLESLEVEPSEMEAVTLLTPDSQHPQPEPRVEVEASETAVDQEIEADRVPTIAELLGDSPAPLTLTPAQPASAPNLRAVPEPQESDSPNANSPESDSPKSDPQEWDTAPTRSDVSAPRRTLSRDELATEAGCDQRLLHELERFNLIAGRTVGSAQVFDVEAIDVAKAAATFASFGLEPRHLRAFRLSAEREIGLVAQIVEPMAHRRSPDAQRETSETLEAMTGLAATMREAMARQVTREFFPDA